MSQTLIQQGFTFIGFKVQSQGQNHNTLQADDIADYEV